MNKENTIQKNSNVSKKKKRKKGEFSQAVKRLSKRKSAIIGFVIIILLILLAIFADVIYDYEEDIIKQNISERLISPCAEHPFGTDELGRDILARIIYGTRISLFIGITANLISMVIGSIFGIIAGYWGKKSDMIVMRLMDVFLAIPGLLLAIAIVAALGTSTRNLIIALSISGIPPYARVMRGAILTVRDVEYIEAARAIGARHSTIILGHILPNCMAPVIVNATLYIAAVIAATAGLSFLGLGIQAPMPEWGAMLSTGRTYIRQYSYMTLFPGVAIMITILAFNLLGDGLRDAFDPRQK